MTVEVAVPSYKRPEQLVRRTLSTLIGGGVSPERITVFTHDNDPAASEYYTAANDTGVKHVENGTRGIVEQRRFIADYYAEGTKVASLDDDVKGIRYLRRGKLAQLGEVAGFLEYAFEETETRGRRIWGVASSSNTFYMKEGVREGLSFLIGCMFGFVSRPGHPVHTVTVPTKDDYEASLMGWWFDGATVRFSGVSADADIYTMPGGLVGQRTATMAEESSTELVRKWPGLVRVNQRRKSEFTEILLAAKNPGEPHEELPETYR